MTIFEKVSSIVNDTDGLTDLRENCIYWQDGNKFATVNVGYNSKYATRIRNLAKQYPEEARIISDKKGDYLVAVIPVKAVKLNIMHRDSNPMTEEHKEALKNGLKEYREAQAKLQTAIQNE